MGSFHLFSSHVCSSGKSLSDSLADTAPGRQHSTGRGGNSSADLARGAALQCSIRLARRAQLGHLGAVSPLDSKAQSMHAGVKAQIRETPTPAQEEALVRRSILQLPVCALRGLIWGNPESIIRCLISSLAFKYIMIQFQSKPHLNTVLKSTLKSEAVKEKTLDLQPNICGTQNKVADV